MMARERERLTLHGVHGCTCSLLGRDDLSSSDVQNLVDTTLGRLWNGNLDQEHGLLESWLGEELSGVTDTSSSWDDLSTTSVNGIGV